MIPAAFDYVAPTSVSGAIALLQQHGADAKLLAGGHSLIPLMKLRLAQPPTIIDISRIPGLAYIREEGGFLRLGALTTETDLEESQLIHTQYPILYDTSRVIADPLVRNKATVGGNIAHADPANDHPATMLALRAQVVATGPGGERVIPIDSFFSGLFETALHKNEILTEIRIPIPGPRSSGVYLKVERKVGDYAIAAVAIQATLDAQGRFAQVGIGLTNAGVTAIRALAAEDYLVGKTPDEATLKQAGHLAAGAAEPSSDRRGPAEYKTALFKTLTVRGLKKVVERIQGGAG